MTSLGRRATARQRKVMRIVRGAALNAADAHKDWDFDPRLASSIAKRAAGTLTAAWPDVLAASVRAPSDSGFLSGLQKAGPDGPNLKGRTGGRASELPWRAPLLRLRKTLGAMAGEARRSGNTERCDALADVLRIIDKIMNGDKCD